MKKTNYHTHTKRCMHACGSDEEYVLAALQNGYETLGFSDHTPWNYKTDFVAHMRMRLDQAQGYLDSVAALKEKYQGKIEILCGFECEYFPGYMDWLLDYLIEHEVDYIIFGHHYYRTDENRDQGDRIYFGGIRDHASLQLYVEDAVSAMKTVQRNVGCRWSIIWPVLPIIIPCIRRRIRITRSGRWLPRWEIQPSSVWMHTIRGH